MRDQIHQVGRTCAVLLALSILPYAAQAATDDPLEPFNRAVFSFNEKADRYVMKPIAKGYKAVTPDPLERGISRMFDNVGEVLNVVNDLLQGKVGQAANDSGRLVVNTTLGLVGFFDVAADMGLEKSEGEDFGQTLGRWGVGSGPYLVIPLLGSSTLRDGPARVVDTLVSPVHQIDDMPTRNGVYATDIVVTRAELLDAEKLVSGDRYVFLRDVYLQRRAYLVNDGEFQDSFGDDFGDDDYYDY